MLELLEVSSAIGGQRVAAIHEGMDEYAVNAVLLRHLQQRVKMRLLRVHATIGEQSKKMQPALAHSRMFHCGQQHRVRKEFAVLNHQVDARDVHVHDAPGANVEMTHLAVAHLPFRQAHKRTAGMNQCVGILAQKAVIGWLARQRDGVRFGFGAVSPAIEDDQYQRLWTRQDSLLRFVMNY